MLDSLFKFKLSFFFSSPLMYKSEHFVLTFSFQRVGALNIDESRIPYAGPTDKPMPHGGKARQDKVNPGWMSKTGHKIIKDPQINPIGRFPSNVIGEVEGYQKYFYCPKVSRKERHCGFEQDLAHIPAPFGKIQGAYVDGERMEIYHTNVMMCVADKYAVVCLDTVDDKEERKWLRS